MITRINPKYYRILMSWIGDVLFLGQSYGYSISDVLRVILITNEAIHALNLVNKEDKFQLIALAAIFINGYVSGHWDQNVYNEYFLSDLVPGGSISPNDVLLTAYTICSLRPDSMYMKLPENIPNDKRQLHIYTPEFLADLNVLKTPAPIHEEFEGLEVKIFDH